MRLRIERVALVGTSREVSFAPGLNVVVGPTTTGKTSLMRLLRVLLGSEYDGLIPELRRVSDLSGRLLIENEQVAIVRRLTQSDNATVDVAADDVAARLPAMRSDRQGQQTYGGWLIDRFGLPQLRVPTAPTRPEGAATTPVSVADYLRYCRLSQTQIDTEVLGSSQFFTDYKRRVVFRIYFGTFDVRVAELQERLRAVEGELRALRSGTSSFDRFLEGTVLANRASIEAELLRARSAFEESVARGASFPDEVQRLPQVRELRADVRRLESELADLDGRSEAETSGAQQMAELARQLRAQSIRLTKAVVADAQLVDFEFRVCPRCGKEVEAARGDDEHCYVCLQTPAKQPTREDLLVEQIRVEAQVDEAEELRAHHEQAVAEIAERHEQAKAERERVAMRLDELTAAFVSDRADEIARLASERARAEAEISQFEEYLTLLAKAEAARARMEHLMAERQHVENELDVAERSDVAARARVEHLEDRFSELVEALQLPESERRLRLAPARRLEVAPPRAG